MTLIMGIAHKDDFVLFSSDSKVVRQCHDIFTHELLSEEIEETDETNSKVKTLSDNVLIATGGNLVTGEVVEKHLFDRIKPEFTLEECARELQNVITFLWNKRKRIVGSEESLALNFIGTKYFSCYIIGFMNDGQSGMASINPESITVDLQVAPNENEYLGFISSPDPKDMDNYGNWLTIRDHEERNLGNFIQQFKLTHGKLSYQHKVEVSPDCNLLALYKEKGNLILYKDVVDTSVLYPLFDEHPEINHKKFYKLY